MAVYRWSRIRDLPENWGELRSNDIPILLEIWKEQRCALDESEALLRFNTKLQRQWAIETGIIEGLYTIDRGITRLLIEKGFDASLIPHGTTDRPVEAILPIPVTQSIPGVSPPLPTNVISVFFIFTTLS